MKVVTSGFPYLDIDAYAGCIAYAELLNLQGNPAIAATSAALNESITQTIRGWGAPFNTSYTFSKKDSFILIDVSDAKHFDKFVDLSKVEEVIDHHPGFEKHLKKFTTIKAQIEFVGSACTLVYERWAQAGLERKMSVTSAKLLITGILDNTLNFRALVTSERDKVAYAELVKIAGWTQDWTVQYFEECQSAILNDVRKAIINDSKLLHFKGLPNTSTAIGQLVIWNAGEVLKKHSAVIKQVMEQKKTEWIVNIVSIDEATSYFICENDTVKKWAERTLNVKFNGSVAKANRLWLRKEIIKQDMAKGSGLALTVS